MPALGGIEARFAREKPFAGLRIAVSVHLEAKTANLGYVLAEGRGAEVPPHRLQPPVHPGRRGRRTGRPWAWRPSASTAPCGRSMRAILIETLKFKPHLIVDDGGDLVHLLGGKCADLGEHLIGGCEETTTGILRLQGPGAGGHPALPHDGGQRRQGQALL